MHREIFFAVLSMSRGVKRCAMSSITLTSIKTSYIDRTSCLENGGKMIEMVLIETLTYIMTSNTH